MYVDLMLPFGLRSAPKIFSALADGLEWYLRHLGVRYVFHYLDDFLVVGPPASPECAGALAQLDSACARLGVPIAEHKREGPLVRMLSMRQPGSSCLPEVAYKSRQALHAHAPDVGLRGGQACILPAAAIYQHIR